MPEIKPLICRGKVSLASHVIDSACDTPGNKATGKYKKGTIPTCWQNCEADPLALKKILARRFSR
ncbi:hypothetical protein CWR40_001908 [Cronobacter sakazakii]|jgi:hypothetical protein|uniref:Uncharacterized protein n=1 Tax=Cronobacter sakazakii TaxID=28141 RepID=A0A7V7RI92_CROSK|nr:hypothetical protein [Cronobacter sakazakii]AKE93758.1 hypothetical protein CSK29544_00795 [Cronobacter sakazakii]AXW98413.2 hypothetical protein CsakCS931_30540 [Cronobacter sakazakii]EIZ2431946.1 hypothetical protein [Cronobacter sakazakii]EIZ2458385.1 hypothetical protein [Cronobacter sakazakii]EIZ9238220.1 hypothetical protein [Cronobacter sakazakii]